MFQLPMSAVNTGVADVMDAGSEAFQLPISAVNPPFYAPVRLFTTIKTPQIAPKSPFFYYDPPAF